MSQKSRRERVEKLNAILADPDNFQDLLDTIAEGGNLAGIARKWDVLYHGLYAYIHDRDNVERLEKYTVALEARRMFYTESIAGRLYQISEADLSQCYDDKGILQPIKKWPENCRSALRTLESTVNKDGDTIKKVQLSDPLRAMELLGKYARMYVERTEHGINEDSLEAIVAASMKQGPLSDPMRKN